MRPLPPARAAVCHDKRRLQVMIANSICKNCAEQRAEIKKDGGDVNVVNEAVSLRSTGSQNILTTRKTASGLMSGVGLHSII